MRNRACLVLALVCSAIGIAACGATSAQQGSGSPAPVAVTNPVQQSGPCDNPYMPVKTGVKWTYDVVSTTLGKMVQTNSITSTAASSFTVAVAAGSTTSWTESWSCLPAGLLRLKSEGGPFAAIVKGPDGQVNVTTKSSTGITVPAHANAGDTWSQSTDQIDQGSALTLEEKDTFTSKAVGLDSVTVPFGTFQAMRVDVSVHIDVINGGQASSLNAALRTWWVPGKGMVKEVFTFGGVTQTSELTNLLIP